MGMTFTTAHIHNSQTLTKAQFKKAFTDMMKEKGYASCDEEDASVTYSLVFSPDLKWVTALTDRTDISREAADFALELRTKCVVIDLVDSDFAELSLFDETGAHKDTLTLGNSYLEDAAPMGDPAAWQPLLRGSWEQVQEIQNSSCTFAEDALAQFAPLIGMDSRDILLDNDSADDDNAVVLHFKKAAEKKLTLNSAFVKVYKDTLESWGFKKIKEINGFARVIDQEIVQIIRIKKDELPILRPGQIHDITNHNFPYKIKGFEIYTTVFSVYCEDFNDYFGKLDLYLYYSTNDIYKKIEKDFFNKPKESFAYFDETSMLNELNKSLIFVKDYVMPIFNDLNSLEDLIGSTLGLLSSADRFPLYILLDDPYSYYMKGIERSLAEAEKIVSENERNQRIEHIKSFSERFVSRIRKIRDDPVAYDAFLLEMKEVKERNINTLRNLGISETAPSLNTDTAPDISGKL